jgi:exonuclease III
MATLTVISCNIRGITTEKKQMMFREWLEYNPHDVVLLQELHMTSTEHLHAFKRRFQDYQIICSIGTWASGGVMMLIRNKLTVVDSATDHAGRIASAKISINSCVLAIVCIYAPAQVTERQSFFKDLHLFIPSVKWILIGGDFNCVPHPVKDRNQHTAQTDKRSYMVLVRELITPLGLTEMFRFKHPKTTTFSFHSVPHHIHSRIDLFLGTDSVKKNTLRVGYVPLAISDHDAITTTLSIPVSMECAHRRWMCNPLVIKRATFMPRFRRIWDVFCNTADFDALEWWADFKVSLVLLLQDEQKQMSLEHRRELKELQKAYRKYAVNPTLEHLDRLDATRAEMRRILEAKVSANTHWQVERNIGSLNALARSSLSNAQTKRSTIPFLDHPTRGRVTTVPEMLSIASAFYQDLYGHKQVDESTWHHLFGGLPKLNEQDRLVLDKELTATECFEALRSMSPGRAPGEDGIPMEVWRSIFPAIGEHYVRMVNTAKRCGHFHDGFLRALLTLLKKDGTPDGPMKSYRPLSLMNTDYKILSKVFNNRLRKVICNIVHHDQTCSIPGRTIHDNIHLIRSIIEQQARMKDPIGIIQWDQEKAFDRINHRYLMGVLRAFGFGEGFIQWVSLLYANGSFRIRLNDGISTPIAFQCGVRQGCALSGSLFVIGLEPLLHRIRENPLIPGLIPAGGQTEAIRKIIFQERNYSDTVICVKVVAYADDITSIARNPEEERETMEMFDLYNRASGGKTNADKMELFWTSDWLPPPRFRTKVKRDTCVFLGVPMDKQGGLPRQSLQLKISTVKMQMNAWSRINLSYGERSTVLRTFILSSVVYWLSLAVIPKDIINQLQKLATSFFWGNRRPKVAHRTLVGRKGDGGLCLPHIQSMIDAYRIKVGLQIISTRKPATWKFYALVNTASKLRRFAPRLWSNMTPHIDHGASLFHEAANATVKWLSAGGKLELDPTDQSIYWQLIYKFTFRRPICQERVAHSNDFPLFRILHSSQLSSVVLDFWYLLANYGINTRARLGTSGESRKCYHCVAPETIAHLFTECPASNQCLSHLERLIRVITGHQVPRTEPSIIYLQNALCGAPDKLSQNKVVRLIGAYLHSVWTYRNDARSPNHRHSTSGALPIFRARIAKHPFDNG